MSGPLLRLPDRELVLDGTLVMGVVNASPESLSDAGRSDTYDKQLARAVRLVEDGADIVDVGGQSAITGAPEISAEEEARRAVPIVRWLRARHATTIVSVDTYKPLVVREVLREGAHIINDVSGLLYPEVAELCAAAGAGLVVMHTKARPKQRLQDSEAYHDVVAEVVEFLGHTMDRAVALGVPAEAIIIDPGPDFAKTPSQTIDLLRHVDKFRSFGRPLLLALSRKDFLGAIVNKPPLGRDAATIAALAHMIAAPGNIARVHDVEAALDAVRTIDTLTGRHEISRDCLLPDRIRHQARDPSVGRAPR